MPQSAQGLACGKPHSRLYQYALRQERNALAARLPCCCCRLARISRENLNAERVKEGATTQLLHASTTEPTIFIQNGDIFFVVAPLPA